MLTSVLSISTGSVQYVATLKEGTASYKTHLQAGSSHSIWSFLFTCGKDKTVFLMPHNNGVQI